MSKYISVSLVIFLLGCQPKEDSLLSEYRGQVRLRIFKECMGLSAKITRQADDDVSDIVRACSNEAYYMSNHIQTVPVTK